MTPRGLLIVIEGLDRSGKTTQCARLQTTLSTRLQTPVRLIKFPDRTTPTGLLINSYLTQSTQSNQLTTQSDHAIHLLFSANRWEAHSQILSLLASGTTVLVDRYSFSGVVYSAAKGIDGLGVEWAWAMEVGLPKPDLVVFLDVDEEVARERGGFGEERYETLERQRRVREVYALVFERVEGVRVRRVDAGSGVEEVERGVWEWVEEVLGEKERGEIGEVGRLEGLKVG